MKSRPKSKQGNKVSDMLENETRKMEEKLQLVKKMMELEKEKRALQINNNSGTMWRGATTKKSIKGHADMIVQSHKKNQPILPPTNRVTVVGQSVANAAGIPKPAIKKQNKEKVPGVA